MQKSDWQLIMELKKTFEIIWTHQWLTDGDHKRPPWTHTNTIRCTLLKVTCDSGVISVAHTFKDICTQNTALHGPVPRTSFSCAWAKLITLLFSSPAFMGWWGVLETNKKKKEKTEKSKEKSFSVRNCNYYHCFKQWQMLENVRQPLQLFQTCLFAPFLSFHDFLLNVHCMAGFNLSCLFRPEVWP